MAHKYSDSGPISFDDSRDVLNDNLPNVKKKMTDNHDNSSCDSSSDNGDRIPECAVCLQTCIHPVKLPCQHIFCYLCVKGAANQSKRCALCRQEIPLDYLNNPSLMRKEDLLKESCFEDGYLWFYEGRNGWWQYDERTSHELEDRYKRDIKVFDLLIAGFLYVIDLENMLQMRRTDPTRRRKIKRDLKDTPKKGVAGIKIANAPPRDGADGTESSQSDKDNKNVGVAPTNRSHSSNTATSVNTSEITGESPSSTPQGSTQSSPRVPHNTPQSPSAQGSPDHPSSPSQQDLSSQIASLSLEPGRNRIVDMREFQREIPQAGSPTSSSDSDWD